MTRKLTLTAASLPAALALARPGSATPRRSSGSTASAGIPGREEVIVGGLSGANANLAGQSGAIGYFRTRRSRLPRRRDVHLLSNSHVFADLQKSGPRRQPPRASRARGSPTPSATSSNASR